MADNTTPAPPAPPALPPEPPQPPVPPPPPEPPAPLPLPFLRADLALQLKPFSTHKAMAKVL